MDAYIQTAIGIVVSVALFLAGYRQTIGAKKERVRSANNAVNKALLRRLVLDNYTPRITEIDRLLQGKASEFRVSIAELNSTEQVLTQVFTEIFDNEFIASGRRVDIENRMSEAFDELIRARSPRVVREIDLPRWEPPVGRNALPAIMGLAASLGGAITVFIYTLQRDKSVLGGPSALSDIRVLLPVIFAFLGSLTAVGVIVLFKRTRESPEIFLRRYAYVTQGSGLEQQISVILKKGSYSYDVEPDVGGGLRPDFLAEVGKKRVAIEARNWRSPPPLETIARLREFGTAVLTAGNVDDVIIVTKARVPIAENMASSRVRFLTVKELPTYLTKMAA